MGKTLKNKFLKLCQTTNGAPQTPADIYLEVLSPKPLEEQIKHWNNISRSASSSHLNQPNKDFNSVFSEGLCEKQL